MQQALQLAPPHISIYHLTIEPNTYFAKFPPAIPEDDQAYAMLDRITEMTGQAGMARYEISAYAQPGHQCFHNTNYWQFGDYLGIGAGAHGKLSFAHRVVRQVRAREPRLYMDKALAGDAVVSVDEVARRDLPFEYMLNALRLRNGFELLSAEEVDKVTVGMTRSQVRYLLGTPMVSDPFAPQRWDYVYRLTHGRPRRTDSAHFIVRFEGDTVVAVEKVDAPEPRVEDDAPPPTPPVISEPQPDAAPRADRS